MSGPHGPSRSRLLPQRRRRARLPGGLAAHPDAAHRDRCRLRGSHRGRVHGRPRPRQPPRRGAERARLAAAGAAALRPAGARGGPLRRDQLPALLRRLRRVRLGPLRDDRRRGGGALRRLPAAHDPHGHVAALPRARHRPRDGFGLPRHRRPLRRERAGRGGRRPSRAVGAGALPRAGGRRARGRGRQPRGRGRGARRGPPGRPADEAAARCPARRPPGPSGRSPRGPSASGRCSTPSPGSSPSRSRSRGSG